jgi:hypothetical protein
LAAVFFKRSALQTSFPLDDARRADKNGYGRRGGERGWMEKKSVEKKEEGTLIEEEAAEGEEDRRTQKRATHNRGREREGGRLERGLTVLLYFLL